MNQVPSPSYQADAIRSRKHGAAAEVRSSPSSRRFAGLVSAIPWRNAAKLMLSGVVVVGLAWLGARNAASEPTPAPSPPALSAEVSRAPAAAAPTGSAGEPDRADAAPAEPAPDAKQAVLADGRVVLNLATEQDLRTLPGIGASRAAAIIALRTKLGRFRATRDLLRIRGIGVRMLRRLEPKVVVDPPPEPKHDGG